ncbi:MAG: Uma2 family endonuclease [Saccharothrix sp.]|nr:Uma2 family endonuclease [Saccharothrix sp.]
MTKPTEPHFDFAHPVFDRLGPWTADHVLATFPEDRLQRVEVIEGALLVHPRGTPRHQVLVGDVLFALAQVHPPDAEVLPGVNVRLADDTLLVPDLVVCAPGEDGLTAPVADLVLAGEVLSSASRFVDLVWKRKLYAEAGVPFYLLVDPTGPVATMFELEGGEYVETARSEAGVLKLERPFPVTIELSP